MPRKIEIPTNSDTRIESPPIQPPPIIKPKRQITDAQREHLNKIRELAMQKKAQLKEITLKSKLAKTVPKQELAAQYDNYIAQKATRSSVNEPPKSD